MVDTMESSSSLLPEKLRTTRMDMFAVGLYNLISVNMYYIAATSLYLWYNNNARDVLAGGKVLKCDGLYSPV